MKEKLVLTCLVRMSLGYVSYLIINSQYRISGQVNIYVHFLDLSILMFADPFLPITMCISNILVLLKETHKIHVAVTTGLPDSQSFITHQIL